MGSAAGAVLTGGAGRRMGGNKPVVPFRGRPLATNVIDALGDAGCDPVVTVGGDPTELELLGVGNVADAWPGEGPLAGTVTATGTLFAAYDVSLVVVAACDLGRLDASTVVRLLEADPDADLVVARGDRLHPSLVRYTRRGADAAHQQFQSGERAMYRFVTAAGAPPMDLKVVECDVEEVRMANVNTPAELDDQR